MGQETGQNRGRAHKLQVMRLPQMRPMREVVFN